MYISGSGGHGVCGRMIFCLSCGLSRYVVSRAPDSFGKESGNFSRVPVLEC